VSVERWSVWLASLDPVVGSEQGKRRPVVIISRTALNDILPVVNVLPVTSRKGHRRIYPNEVLLPATTAKLPNESIVLCYQIRTLDKRRLERKLGILGDVTLHEAILDALDFQLGTGQPRS
jgi:mRNA interferase MazF